MRFGLNFHIVCSATQDASGSREAYRGCHRATCVFFILLLYLLEPSTAEAQPSTGSRNEAGLIESSWRETRYCGPNALYLWMRTNGWNGTLADVRRQVPLGDNGCSMMDLWRGAEAFGVKAQVVKADIAGLSRSQLPVIVHLDSLVPGKGHFMLVAAVGRNRVTNEDVVQLIDPITASVKEYTMGNFERGWTGYELVAGRADNIGYPQIILAIAGVAGAMLLLLPGVLSLASRRGILKEYLHFRRPAARETL
jgi:hypothetical protein